MNAPRIFREAPPEASRLDLEGFLEWLGQPAIFHLKGADSSRCRVLSGGLHGNEPSGFYAIHELLKAPPVLPVDAVLVLGNVPAALHEVPFTHRFVPGTPDMNRVWGPDAVGPMHDLAMRIREYLDPLPCEAFVDLHNNTGRNPIYGVLIADDPNRVALGRAWTHRFVLYGGQSMGTFLEVYEPRAPGVVIECGQAGNAAADHRALAGACRFLESDDPFAAKWASNLELHRYRSIARIHVSEDLQLAFDDSRTVADLTISPSIDRYNFQVMEAGSHLAFCNENGYLTVIGNEGADVTDDYLETRDGVIFLKRSIVPVMMTTDGVVAKSDCLLYAAELLGP